MWQHLALENLSVTSILIDLPGHGGSSGINNGNPSIEAISLKVKEVIDHLNIDLYHVIGHSMGGYVALELKDLDLRCQKITLLNSNYWNDSVQRKKDRIRVAEIVFKAKDFFLSEAIPRLYSNTKKYNKEISILMHEASKMLPEDMAYCSIAMGNRKDFSSFVTENKADVYIIHGALDHLVNTADFEPIFLSDDPHFYLFPKAGHMCHVECENTTFLATLMSPHVQQK